MVFETSTWSGRTNSHQLRGYDYQEAGGCQIEQLDPGTSAIGLGCSPQVCLQKAPGRGHCLTRQESVRGWYGDAFLFLLGKSPHLGLSVSGQSQKHVC